MSEQVITERAGRLYGRKWKICIYKKNYTEENKDGVVRKVHDPQNDIMVDVSELRCAFRVEQKSNTPATVCILEVYNMNPTAEKGVIEEGWQISIEAGYEEGPYGELFHGDVMQVIRNRENGIDYKLEIIALNGTINFNLNHVKTSLAAGSEARDVVEAASKQAIKSFKVGEVSSNLSKQKLPRGKVLFGTPAKYLRYIAQENNAHYWADTDNKLIVKKIEDEIPADKCLVLKPGNPDANEPNMGGMVGTPQYGDDGIRIKMLIDARVKMYCLVKIDNGIITRKLISPDTSKSDNEQKSQQNEFDKDGEYQVFSISHSGDTYGNEWYTDVVGVGRMGRQGKLLAEKM